MMFRKRFIHSLTALTASLTALLTALLLLPAMAYGQTKLLRFPDINGDKVVFTYGGDLWIAPISGSQATPATATRLTAHPGVELFAKFSPDGKWIAFTGQYDGDEQVYVIPVTGGEPKQLTYYPARGRSQPAGDTIIRSMVGRMTAKRSSSAHIVIRGRWVSRIFTPSR